MSSRTLRVPVTLAILSCSCWCANLDSVADLSKVADGMRASLPVISGDIAATCERRAKLLADIPADEKSPIDQPQNCAPFRATADQVAVDQSVLIAYLDALARLSSNRPPAYQSTIAGNVTTLSADTGVSTHVAAASSAAQKVLGSLADLATQGYRRKRIATLIETTDPAVQQLTVALKDVVTKDYTILLQNEQTSLTNYYEVPMAEQKGQRLMLILVQRQYDADTTALADRRATALAYGAVMTSVADVHAHLAAEAHSKISAKRLVQQLGPSISTLKDAVAALDAAERR